MPSIEELKKLIKNHELWYPRWRKQFRILWIRSIFSQCFSKFSIFEAFNFLGAIITICFLASCFPKKFTRCLSNLSTVLGGFKCLLSSPYLGWWRQRRWANMTYTVLRRWSRFSQQGWNHQQWPKRRLEIRTHPPKCGRPTARPSTYGFNPHW